MTYQFSGWKYATADNSLIDVTVTNGEDVFPFTYAGPGDGAVSDAVAAYIQAENPTIAAYVAPAITAADVNDEAQRRIIERCGATDLTSCMIKQHNATMRAIELTRKEMAQETLTAQEQSEAAALEQLAADIKAVRAASDVLNAMSPIPTDFTDDSYWP